MDASGHGWGPRVPGEVFGPYRLESLLGAGGMGQVWRAVDTDHGDRVVALKVLAAAVADDADFTRRFRRESALAAGLNAPTIVPIHSYGEIDGRLFIDMALIDGRDLGDIIDRDGPLRPDRAVRIVDQVADALDTAHRAGLVHRDVKPSNILVTSRGRGREFVYLIDFGIARPTTSSPADPRTMTGAVVGTPAYMAPERFDGEGDHRSDVYSLACVLFEALTGEPPFRGPGLWSYLHAHRTSPPPRPGAAVPDLPPALDQVIARGLAKRPDHRFATAGALATAAEAALVGPPPRTPPAPTPQAAIPPAAAPPAALRQPARRPDPPATVGSAAPSPIAGSGPAPAFPPRPPASPTIPPTAPHPIGAARTEPAPPRNRALVRRAVPGRPQSSRRKLIGLVGAGALVVLVIGSALARLWVLEQYYVGVDDDQVAIYQGVRGEVLGVPLHQIAEKTTIALSDLPASERALVAEGVQSTTGLPGARGVIDTLERRLLPPCPATPAPGARATDSPPADTAPLSTASPEPGLTCRFVG
jgi:serine/threonine protein kinase